MTTMIMIIMTKPAPPTAIPMIVVVDSGLDTPSAVSMCMRVREDMRFIIIVIIMANCV